MRAVTKKLGRQARVQRRIYWLLCAPAGLVLLVVIGVPAGYTIHMGTRRYDLLNQVTTGSAGFGNYLAALQDNGLHDAVLRTLAYVAITGLADLAIGFIQALIVFSVRRWIGRLLKMVFILPILLVPSAAATFWAHIMYGPPFSQVNRIFGIPLDLPILGDTRTAFIGILVTVVWAWSPWSFILLSSGMQSLNRDPLEAAQIDGANFWQRVRYVIWPMMMPVIFVTVIFKAVASLNTFAFPWAMTKGGPDHSTEVLATYIYNNSFTLLNFGYGSAQSILVLILGILAAWFAARTAVRRSYV
jgi:ABC-type sugar transport system permease subunit